MLMVESDINIVQFCYHKNFDDPDPKEKNVDTLPNKTLILACRDCEQKPYRERKYWYKKSLFPNLTLSQTLLPEQITRGNVYMDSFHRLIIQDIDYEDLGFYYCKRLEDDNVKYGFIYFVDVVQFPQLERFKGNSSTLLTYHNLYINKANDKLKENDYNFTTFIEWGKWNSCSSDMIGERVRKRIGRCRIKSILPPKNVIEIEENILDISFSCYSSLIDKKITEIIGPVPLFEYIENCTNWFTFEDSRNFDIENRNIELDVDSSLTIACPHSNVYSDITWYKNDKVIFYPNNVTNQKDVHIYFDAMRILYLADVNKNDEGLYSCEVNGKKSLELKLVVNERPKVSVRSYFLNLFFIFMMSFFFLPFYCCCLNFYLKKHMISFIKEE